MDADDLRADTEYALASKWTSMPLRVKCHVFAGLFPNAKSFAPNANKGYGNLLSVLNPDLDTRFAFTVHRDGWLMQNDATSVIHYWERGNWDAWDMESTWMGSPRPESSQESSRAIVPQDAWLDDPVLRVCEAALTSIEYAKRLRDKWLNQAFAR